MRKIFIIVLIFALLSGCAQKPESVLVDYFKALKTADSSIFDQSQNDQFFSGDTQFDDFAFSMDTDGVGSEYSKKFGVELIGLVQQFDYKVNSTKMVDDNNATVNVEITTFPIASMISQLMIQAFAAAFSGSLSTEEASEKFMYDNFVTLKSSATKNYINTVDVYLIKNENKWQLVGGDKNNQLINGLFGGLLDYANSISDTSVAPKSDVLIEAKGFNSSTVQNGIEFTAIKTRISSGSDYMKAQEGFEYLVIEINLKNQNKEAFSVSSMMNFELKDKEGRTLNQNYFVDVDGELDGSIYPNEQMTGEVAYEVPKDGSALYLYFKTDYFQNNAIKLKVR